MALSTTICLLVILGLFKERVQAQWTQTWSDEFDGAANTAPDGGKWGYDIGGGGWGNAERQYYTSTTNNAALDGAGNLVITARNDDAGQYDCHYGKCEYTSARILTKGKFEQQNGKFEARLKTPSGKGIWPAFWMLGNNIDTVKWPNCGEIDIMELRGSNPKSIAGTIHGPEYFGGGGLTKSYDLPSGTFADDFHIFTVEWTDTTIKWSVDGNEYHTQTKDQGALQGKTWVFDHPFFIIFNLAVGGNFDGNPDGSTTFPQTMTIDYVRVYRQG